MAGSADFEELGDRLGDRSSASNERTRLGGASALVAAVALVAFPGESPAVAVLGALVVLAAWYLLAPTYAFALGHVALAAVLPEEAFAQGTSLVWMAAVEAGLLGILLASVTSHSPEGFGDSETADGPGIRDGPDDREDSKGLADSASRAVVGVGLVLVWVAVGGGLAWASARSSLGLPAAGGLLVVSAGLAAYGLHRYLLVSLGLVDDRDEGEYDESGDDDERGDGEGRADEERNDEKRYDEEKDDEEGYDEAVGDASE